MNEILLYQPTIALLIKVNGGGIYGFIHLEIKNLTHLYSCIAGE